MLSIAHADNDRTALAGDLPGFQRDCLVTELEGFFN
jgi:hypothetical protein